MYNVISLILDASGKCEQISGLNVCVVIMEEGATNGIVLSSGVIKQ